MEPEPGKLNAPGLKPDSLWWTKDKVRSPVGSLRRAEWVGWRQRTSTAWNHGVNSHAELFVWKWERGASLSLASCVVPSNELINALCCCRGVGVGGCGGCGGGWGLGWGVSLCVRVCVCVIVCVIVCVCVWGGGGCVGVCVCL